MKTEKLELNFEDLLLDLENPRTGSTSSQSEALSAIVRLSTRNFGNMMHSIKTHELDPGDSFYVVQEQEEFVVVDGNRRLAALKVLQSPDLLHGTDLSETIKRPLIKKTEGFEKIDPVNCVLFKNRADAGEWIERRHGRGLDGEGRIAWGAVEIQRFQKDPTVLDVISFVERNSTYSDAEWQRVRAAVEKNTSTLRRFLESRAGKTHLGFVSRGTDGKPEFTFDSKFEIDVLTRLFSDIASGEVNTRTHNKASEIEDYFSSLPKTLSSSTQKTVSGTSFATAIVKDSKDRPRQKAKAARKDIVKAKKVSAPRRTLAPSKHPFKEPENEKGKQLIREVSKIQLKDAPLASAYLMRAVLEYTIDTEMRNSRLPKERNGETLDLKARLESVISHLNSSDRTQRGDLTPVRASLTAKNGPVSIGALNGYIHNRFQLPSADDLRNLWDHAVPLLVAVFGAHS